MYTHECYKSTGKKYYLILGFNKGFLGQVYWPNRKKIILEEVGSEYLGKREHEQRGINRTDWKENYKPLSFLHGNCEVSTMRWRCTQKQGLCSLEPYIVMPRNLKFILKVMWTSEGFVCRVNYYYYFRGEGA